MIAAKMSRPATLIGLGLILGCSSGGGGGVSGLGGTTAGSGGTNESGGKQGPAGASGTGVAQDTGGTTGSGGSPGSGGAMASGGATTGSGGATASAGSTTASGGATATAGVPPGSSGATASAGATTGSGGRTGSGGATSASGGTQGSGGQSASGRTATGGTTGAGGTQGTGGATASAGTTAGSGGRAGSGGATSASGGTQGFGGQGTAGRSGTGGAAGTGGTQSTGGATIGSGGAQGSGGTTGSATRPSYNTGTGFFVLNGKLYDANGVEFRIRGVDRNHYDMDAPGIPKTHANTERTVLFFNGEWGSTGTRNVQVMQQDMINNHIVPMPGNWEGTCDESTATLTTIVDRWVAQVSTYKALDKYMILNIANEWGPADSTVWRDSYVTAVQRLRTAGYTCTISVDSGGCGQDNADLAKYAQAVFDADPQKNVIFDQHIYGNWGLDAGKQSWQQGLIAGFDALAATGLPVIIGEFGPGRNIGPSPTNITPQDIIQAAEARNLGWLAWAWDDNPSAGDDWFALSLNGDYNSSADLTTFGKSVVEGAGYGLLALAKPATAW